MKETYLPQAIDLPQLKIDVDRTAAARLKLTQTDAEMDAAIKSVCDKMKAEHDKSRVAFYFLLADHYGKLSAL